MLFSLFFSEKDEPPKVSVDTYRDLGVFYYFIPCRRHAFWPVNIVDDDQGILVNKTFYLLKIIIKLKLNL